MFDYNKLPKKPVGAGALFFNQTGQILLVKPTYKDGWSLPGGSVEDQESPRVGCMREVTEEIGLDIEVRQLLCVDFVANMANGHESIQFMFYGGILTGDDIAQIKLPADELSDYKFVEPSEAISLARPNLQKRLPYCLQALASKSAIYLEDGEPI